MDESGSRDATHWRSSTTTAKPGWPDQVPLTSAELGTWDATVTVIPPAG